MASLNQNYLIFLPVWEMEKNDKFKAQLSDKFKAHCTALGLSPRAEVGSVRDHKKRRTIISSTSTDAEVSFELEVIEGDGAASQKDSAWLAANVVTIYFGILTWDNGAGMHAKLKFNEMPASLVPVIETPIAKANLLVAGRGSYRQSAGRGINAAESQGGGGPMDGLQVQPGACLDPR